MKSTFAYRLQIIIWVYVWRTPGPIKHRYILLCHELFHHFRCVTGGNVVLRDSRSIGISLFQLWNNTSSKNFIKLWRAHHAFDWLNASDTVVTKQPPKYLFLRVLSKPIYMESRMFFSDDLQICWLLWPCTKKWLSSLKKTFLHCSFIQSLYFFFPLLSFVSLLWLKAFLCFFTGLLSFRPTVMRRLRTVEELIGYLSPSNPYSVRRWFCGVFFTLPQWVFWSGFLLTTRDAYNGISKPMDSNPSVFESKNLSFFEYLDLK